MPVILNKYNSTKSEKYFYSNSSKLLKLLSQCAVKIVCKAKAAAANGLVSPGLYGLKKEADLMDKLERNKKNVTAFYDLMFNQSKPAEAFKLYGGATYKQHNPTVPDGKEAFIEFFDQLSKQVPEKHVSVKHVVAEGDLVVLHGEQSYGGPDKTASVDIFKVDDDGKIIEHWDVLQPEPKESKNDNGMV